MNEWRWLISNHCFFHRRFSTAFQRQQLLSLADEFLAAAARRSSPSFDRGSSRPWAISSDDFSSICFVTSGGRTLRAVASSVASFRWFLIQALSFPTSPPLIFIVIHRQHKKPAANICVTNRHLFKISTNEQRRQSFSQWSCPPPYHLFHATHSNLIAFALRYHQHFSSPSWCEF